MYRARLSLQNIEDTITRPIVLAVLSDIKKLIKIDPDTPYLLGDDDHDQLDRTIDVEHNKGTLTSPRSEVIHVLYEEEGTEGDDLSMLVNNPDSYPFYNDSELHSQATAVSLRRSMTITFRYYNKSKTAVTALTNRLRMMTSNDSMYAVHDLEYYYNIPHYLLKLLLTMNDLKNKDLLDTDKLTPETYIDNTFDSRVDFINSLDGLSYKSELGIREAQVGVLGNIDTSLADIKKEYVNDKSSWAIEFTYKLQYDKPVAILIDYPMAVFNRIIPKEFRMSTEEAPKGMPKRGRRSRSNQALMDIINKDEPIITNKKDYYLKIPKEDTLVLPKPLPFMVRLLAVKMLVDRQNPTALCALDEIPNISFKKNITKLIEKECLYTGDKYKSMLYFNLFDHGKMSNIKVIITPVVEQIGVDPETNQPIMKKRLRLKTSEALSYKGNYRLALSMVTDLSSLQVSVKKRLNSVFNSVDEDIKIEENEEFNKRVENGFIPVTVDDSIEKLLIEVNKKIGSNNNGNVTRIKLIDNLSKHGININNITTVNDLLGVYKTFPNIINISSLAKTVAEVMKYNGLPVVKTVTAMDFINVFSINPGALKNLDSLKGADTIKTMETVLTENISEKTFTREYVMVLSSLFNRK